MRILHWNVLASYLGHNHLPWFLHGLNIDPTRRAAILSLYNQRDPITNLPVNPASKYLASLTSEERTQVAKVHALFFAWPRRFQAITSYLKATSPDIISLVELDQFPALLSALEPVYSGVFARRPRPISLDGSSLFWKRDKFRLLHHRSITFIDAYMPEAISDRCAVVALVESNEAPYSRFIVVSVHLARQASEPGKELRARQLSLLAQSLRECCLNWGEADDATPVILCGDVNEAHLYKLQGLVAVSALLSNTMLHPFVFSSRPVPLPGPTSVTEARSVSVDALFVSSQMRVDGVSMPGHGIIPNETTPSDHFPILVDLSFKTPDQISGECAQLWWRTILGLRDELFCSPGDLRRAFDRIDQDGDGLVSVHDAEASLARTSLGVPLPSIDWPLDFADFCSTFFSANSSRHSPIALAAFEAMDSAPRDGAISETELGRFLTSFDHSDFACDTRHVLAEAAARGVLTAGGLTFEDFETLLRIKFVEMWFPLEADKIVRAIRHRRMRRMI